MTQEYNYYQINGPDEKCKAVDESKANHHDASAKMLEQILLDNGIVLSGDFKRDKNGNLTDVREAARNLFGSITDAMTPLLSRINPEVGIGRLADKDS